MPSTLNLHVLHTCFRPIEPILPESQIKPEGPDTDGMLKTKYGVRRYANIYVQFVNTWSSLQLA